MDNLLIFGDSITRGEFDLEGGGWAERLKAYAFARRVLEGQKPLYVYPLGIPGESSDGVTKRLIAEISIRQDPGEEGLVLLATGINDSKIMSETGTNATELSIFTKRYEKFITDSKDFGATVWCIGLTRSDESGTPTSQNRFVNAEIEKYDAEIKRLAALHGVPYIQMSDVFPTNSQYMSDTVHPNAEGHRLMFERVKEHLEKAGIL